MKGAVAAILLCRCAFAQPAAISGVAADATTRQPLPHVHVSLFPVSRDGSAPENNTYGAISQPDGRFSISGIAPALYAVLAQRNGYIYTGDERITIEPGDSAALTIPMSPEAVISGAVIDAFGDPVPNIMVAAETAPGTKLHFSRFVMNVNTDDRGWYRIALPPGKFLIKADVPRVSGFNQTEIRVDGFKDPVYSATWYPDSPNENRATVIELQPGQKRESVDIRLAQQPNLSIRGTISGSRGIEPVLVTLSSQAEGIRMNNDFVAGPRGGGFRFTGVSPGAYMIEAVQGDSLRSAPYEARVESSDLDGIALNLAAPEVLTGTVEFSGGRPPGKVYVQLSSVAGSLGDSGKFGGEVGSDGAFRIEHVFAGKYRVRAIGLPENAYTKSVQVDRIEAPDFIVDFSYGIGGARLRIAVSPNGGQIECITAPDELMFVTLVQSAAAISPEDMKFAGNGKIRFTGLRPGKYRLITINPEQRMGGIDALRELFAHAPEIEVHEGDRIVRDAKP